MSFPKKKLLVVAANYNDFLNWCRMNAINHSDPFVKFVNRPEQLRGFKKENVNVEFTKRGWNNPLVGHWLLEKLL
jgi:hypothetical protein